MPKRLTERRFFCRFFYLGLKIPTSVTTCSVRSFMLVSTACKIGASVPYIRFTSMKHVLFNGSLFCVAVSASLPLSAQTLREERIPLQIVMEDGRTYDQVLKYRGIVNYRKWETGGPAVLDRIPPKLEDDRQCHYEITAFVQRDLCATSPITGEQCLGEWTNVMHLSDSGSGEPFNLFKRIQGENCGQAGPGFDRIAEEVRGRVVNELPTMMEGDHQALRSTLAQSPGVKEIR